MLKVDDIQQYYQNKMAIEKVSLPREERTIYWFAGA